MESTDVYGIPTLAARCMRNGSMLRYARIMHPGCQCSWCYVSTRREAGITRCVGWVGSSLLFFFMTGLTVVNTSHIAIFGLGMTRRNSTQGRQPEARTYLLLSLLGVRVSTYLGLPLCMSDTSQAKFGQLENSPMWNTVYKDTRA